MSSSQAAVILPGANAMAGLRALANRIRNPFFIKCVSSAVPLSLEECLFFYKGFFKSKVQVQVSVPVGPLA